MLTKRNDLMHLNCVFNLSTWKMISFSLSAEQQSLCVATNNTYGGINPFIVLEKGQNEQNNSKNWESKRGNRVEPVVYSWTEIYFLPIKHHDVDTSSTQKKLVSRIFFDCSGKKIERER